MPPKVKEELQVFNLDNLNPALLPELATFKEIQLKVVQDNPFVVITDSASRDLAKKYRTARKTARTDLEKQDKLISSKFNDAKTKAKSYIAELIDISLPGEKKQQEEIDRDEEFLQLQRQEKARVEQQRIDNIKKELEDYVTEWKTTFGDMSFETIEKVYADFLESYTTYDLTVLEEFESFFPKKVEELTNILSYHTTALTEKENARLEKLRLEEEAKKLATMKAELEAEKKRTAEVEARAKFEKEQFEKEKAEFEENKQIEKQKSEYQLKVDGRISQLTDLELKFDFQSTFVGFNFFIDILDIKTYDDEKWNSLILKIEDVKSTPLAETVKGIVEDHAIELIQNLDLSDAVEPTANVCYDLPKEPTWDSIAEDFKNSGGKSYSKWLKDNYNVPTKIQCYFNKENK